LKRAPQADGDQGGLDELRALCYQYLEQVDMTQADFDELSRAEIDRRLAICVACDRFRGYYCAEKCRGCIGVKMPQMAQMIMQLNPETYPDCEKWS
jgi:hypothetical protein